MAKVSHGDSRRKYSWWWDSHISPKNSKWLKDNLTEMDANVKAMIKLIEEDADSFARRAEMYYRKRPELLKMVEDFYRAYRAMAERYDHATGVIRQAHRTMSEAFPNQVPLMFGDESPANSDPRTPDMLTPIGESTDESDSRKPRKPFSDSFGPVVRRGINFNEVEDKDQATHDNENSHAKDSKLSKSNQETEEIRVLKEKLTKLEAEKQAGLGQYQQSLDKLSQLQTEISKINEDCVLLTDRASKAEDEVEVLKKAITKFEAEKDSMFQEYQQSVEKISNLQTKISTSEEDAHKLNERANAAEIESQALKGELDKLAAEKDAALDKYMHSLEVISNLENKLLVAEEYAQNFKERAEKAESEVENLRQTISKLTEEKENAALRYQQCLETISSLENKLAHAEEEAKRLNMEIDNGVTKLKGAEEQCLLLERSNQSLHSELESLMLKMGSQTQELTEKQKELGKLWACIQEERLRFVEAETAFQTLQHLHAQTQEDLRVMASELQNRAQLLQVMETQNNSLQGDLLKVKQENKNLEEHNAASSLSIKDMENEISSLVESKGKLQEEVELRLDQRNALQQEIYCLKEELNTLNTKHDSVLDQVSAVGLNPESLESSVKELQHENSRLKDDNHREHSEKAALLEKLKDFEQLLEKNSLLETSLSDLNAELGAVRGKIDALEQSYKSLLEEKSALCDEKATLVTQLHETRKNLGKLSENNTVLESFIADAHRQLEALKAKSKILEDSCQLLVSENAGLQSEKDGLTSQLANTTLRLETLKKLHGELEGRCMTLEKENESALLKVEELQMSLEAERQEHASYAQMNETRFNGIVTEMSLLKEECRSRKREIDQVLDNTVKNEIEIFVLRMTAAEMKEYNSSLSVQNQKLSQESSLSLKKISQLERNNCEQQVEIKALSDQTGRLRAGTSKLLQVLDIAEHCERDYKAEQDHTYFNQLLNKLQTMKKSIRIAEEENMEYTVELSVLLTWLRQLKLDAQNLEVEKNKLDNELNDRTKKALALQKEVATLLQMNEELGTKLKVGDCSREAMAIQIDDLNRKLVDMQGSFQVLQRQKMEIFEENGSLMNNILRLEEKNGILEEENDALCDIIVSLENLSMIFRSSTTENFMALKELGNDRNKLHGMNAALVAKLSTTERSLEESKTENLQVKEKLQKMEDELKVVAAVKDQFADEIENGKKLVSKMALELKEAEDKIGTVEKEKVELNHQMEDLKINYNEVKLAKDQHENRALNLSTDYDQLHNASNRLQETCHKLESELHELQDENNKRKIQEENLQVELQKKLNVIEGMALELHTAVERINLAEKEKVELNDSMEDLRTKFNEVKLAQESHIFTLSTDKDHLSADCNSLREACQKLESELHESFDENNKRKLQEENLQSELQKKLDVIEGLTLELHTAGEKISLLEKERVVLNHSMEDLRSKFNEIKVAQENQIFTLSSDKDHLSGECNSLREACQKLESELHELENENNKGKIQEENLQSELQKKLSVIEGMALELHTAVEKISLLEKENLELSDSMEDLRSNFNDYKLAQDSQILVLSADNDHLTGELNSSREACQKLELELHEVHDENNKRKIQEENLRSELQNKSSVIEGMALELNAAVEKISLVEKEKVELSKSMEDLRSRFNEFKLAQDSQILTLSAAKDHLTGEHNSLREACRKLESELHEVYDENNKRKIEEENLQSELQKKLSVIEGMALELHTAVEKISLVEKEKVELRDSMEDLRSKFNEAKLAQDQQESQILKLSADNEHLSEVCQKLEGDLHELHDENNTRCIQEETLSSELQKRLKEINEMALKLREAEEKIGLLEIEKVELSESVEDLRIKCDEVQSAKDEQDIQTLNLSADNDNLTRDCDHLREACQKLETELHDLQDEHNKRRIKEENLQFELQEKLKEINELEAQAASIYSMLQYSMIGHLLYEQKFNELHEACLSYMDQNEGLRTHLAAYDPEIVLLKECISSLENQTNIHTKFQDPTNDELEGDQVSNDPRESISNDDDKSGKANARYLRNLRIRLQAIVTAAVELKDLMVKENTDLHSKLDASIRQIEMLQSESGRYRRNRRPTSEITEADNALLTKDIMLDQVSDSSSYRFSKKEPADVDNHRNAEFWETTDPDRTVGLTVGKSKKTVPPSTIEIRDLHRTKSAKKKKDRFPSSDSLFNDELSFDKLEISSKRSSDLSQDITKRKVLERLDSDVQKLANLQITVQDLKRKLDVTEKSKRGKAVIECESLKGQLDEADMAIMKLFDFNGRLMKSIDDRSFTDTKSSFDLEGDDRARRRRRASEQARRMSEKIGRLQLEVQKLQFVLLKLDDEKDGKNMSETSRRILLRDYLYGVGRAGYRRKKTRFCACVEPSTVED